MAGELIEVSIQGIENLRKSLGDTHEGLRQSVRDWFNRSVLRLERDAKRFAPADIGRLRSSITHQVDKAQMPLWGKVGVNVSYAPYMEYGTKPHFPPPEALEDWAQRHGFPPGGGFLVARAIARHGLRPRDYFGKSYENNKDAIEEDSAEIERQVEDTWNR